MMRLLRFCLVLLLVALAVPAQAQQQTTTINGHQYGRDQFIQEPPHPPICNITHFHAANGFDVTDITGHNTLSDPGGCGFGALVFTGGGGGGGGGSGPFVTNPQVASIIAAQIWFAHVIEEYFDLEPGSLGAEGTGRSEGTDVQSVAGDLNEGPPVQSVAGDLMDVQSVAGDLVPDGVQQDGSQSPASGTPSQSASSLPNPDPIRPPRRGPSDKPGIEKGGRMKLKNGEEVIRWSHKFCKKLMQLWDKHVKRIKGYGPPPPLPPKLDKAIDKLIEAINDGKTPQQAADSLTQEDKAALQDDGNAGIIGQACDGAQAACNGAGDTEGSQAASDLKSAVGIATAPPPAGK